MRIVHVIDSLDIGGAEMIVATLARIHRSQGHTVEVHCLFRAGALAQQLEGIPVHVHGLTTRRRLVPNLYRDFQRQRPDIVHSHNAFATTVAVPAGKLAGCGAIVCTRHGLVPTPRRRRHAFFWLIARWADRVVAVCDVARKNLAAAPFAAPMKLITIRNGAVAAPSEKATKEGFTIVTVARLAPPKDLETLLRAVARASHTVTDIRLCVLGDGVEFARLVGLAAELGIADLVEFLGERQDVGIWLARAHLFALSSRAEGVPISLLEAMAAGLPFLVTDVGGMPEIAALSQAGTVVPAGDSLVMAEKIEELASIRHRLPEIGRLAQRCYWDHFTPDQMADDYMALYRDCLSQNVSSETEPVTSGHKCHL